MDLIAKVCNKKLLLALASPLGIGLVQTIYSTSALIIRSLVGGVSIVYEMSSSRTRVELSSEGQVGCSDDYNRYHSTDDGHTQFRGWSCCGRLRRRAACPVEDCRCSTTCHVLEVPRPLLHKVGVRGVHAQAHGKVMEGEDNFHRDAPHSTHRSRSLSI